ncbi:MAG: ribonuclease III [Candidatus Thiodiazotropha lotti]|uniref:Ribonuclease 3 n=1 Tax=Candidatus Thiodiazotropha endoloripes TaxID=1818881 RepID=A0A1E2UT68_9GAMM|nr:ribonuclease III [Candidatus Thiodiazotropha endoloripes]MCG7898559.1 ribonuclease III [Candidatus Thiodiazotropha weberae]MCG7990812.1 ribonuclease III [Candidatus Thiodiazotropha lotti]MCG7901444.1 ribonuclease III [Candidatus Thiodiazotropha weberae]MCG7913722.1 ribonuclease III [Candidatus Thiodiazotropha weberae]MCG7999324.1 ribonuclease III [Candidatus Thiodiazotropha lotti]
MKADAEKLCRDLGYTFNQQELIEQALTHRSAGGKNNERLEYLGDSILGFVIADALFSHFSKATEGQLSRLRSTLVKRDTLAQVAREFNLGDYLKLGQGELRSGGQSRDSILADSFEAVLAAVYLDGGYEATRSVILKIFSPRLIALSPENQQKDPKTQLQEHLQAIKVSLPSYTILDVSGDPHAQHFKVECVVEDLQKKSKGEGHSRRKAEQDAASKMLSDLNNE